MYFFFGYLAQIFNRRHYSFYLKDGMSVLELGAAEESYLPDGLQLERHVGVGANQKLMDQNSALTESFVANFNDVIEERGVNSEEMKALGSDQFDAIIMANTVDFLTNPREVFRYVMSIIACFFKYIYYLLVAYSLF